MRTFELGPETPAQLPRHAKRVRCCPDVRLLQALGRARAAHAAQDRCALRAVRRHPPRPPRPPPRWQRRRERRPSGRPPPTSGGRERALTPRPAARICERVGPLPGDTMPAPAGCLHPGGGGCAGNPKINATASEASPIPVHGRVVERATDTTPGLRACGGAPCSACSRRAAARPVALTAHSPHRTQACETPDCGQAKLLTLNVKF